MHVVQWRQHAPQLAVSSVLKGQSTMMQVAAAQNKALDQTPQTDAMMLSPELLSNTPSMAELQREHEEQYGYQQMLSQQQQQAGCVLE